MGLRRIGFGVAGAALALGMAVTLRAQIEGGERGVPPIDSSSSFEVSGIKVDVTGPTAEAARVGGWREAQRRGWRSLWRRTHGSDAAPNLSDSTLDSIVSGIVVEQEGTGPRRYVATLGVLFDRARTGQILGVTGRTRRSAPLLVIPIQVSGGAMTALELRNPWQEAWARFRTGNSPVDYVRPVGTGPDPLLLNQGQTERRGRVLWRQLLDQYGAADVIVPQVSLSRLWPGGPVVGRFSAYHGPDRRLLGSFSLRGESSAAIAEMLDEGVRRLDEIYVAALTRGALTPDPSLVIEEPIPEELPEELLAEDGVDPFAGDQAVVGVTQLSVQFDSPDAGAVNAAEAALRAIPGVRSAVTGSLAIGGVSVMRVAYEGEAAALATALESRGWSVSQGGGSIRISRRAPAAQPAGTPPAQ